MTDFCQECGRAFPDGGDGDPLDGAYEAGFEKGYAKRKSAEGLALGEALLLAEKWLRSSDQTTRMMGADLKQVLSDGC